ncbi:MAG: fused MFS/spermidine synthase [Chloroflexota bacterium]
MQRYLYFTVFVSGMTTLAVELSASRLLGNVFGTSNLVWAAIIGLILIYLTLGYFLGGRWADRSPAAATMYGILAWGAFTVGIVPYVARPVLLAAANAFDGLEVGVMLGSFVAVLVLFSIPITLLGMVSPFAIRLSLEDPARAGNVSGNIYAISTLGSFIGTFLPVLVLTPTIGTTRTFLVFSVFLLCVAIAGLLVNRERRLALLYLGLALLLALVAVLFPAAGIKQSEGQVYETESAYNYIQVVQRDGYTTLRLNDGQGTHSIYHPTVLDYNGPWEQFLAGPFFNPGFRPGDVERIAIVGSAAGTTARQATAVFGPIPIDGFEIDPKIAAVGREYFGMTMPNFDVIIGDGRYGLAHSPHTYDLIAVDAYRPPYIPWHMTTREFFQAAYDHLDETGVLAINAASVPGDRRLINGLATTIASVFPSVHVMDIPGTLNSIIYATRQSTRPETLTDNLMALYADGGVHPLLLDVILTATQNFSTYEPAAVFTDDLAPIEWITNDMVIRFILSGEVETLQ